MTAGEKIVKELIKKSIEIYELMEQMEDLESNLHGMEFDFDGEYAVIESISGMQDEVDVYVELNGRSHYVTLTLDELAKYLKR